MHLLQKTLQPSAQPVAVAAGSFSAKNAHELLLATAHAIHLYHPHPHDDPRLILLATDKTFGTIRSLTTIRLPGASTDHVAVGSDSGRLAILAFDATKKAFTRVHCETFGKAGLRRVVPGQFIAADPKGRALLVGALERQKFVYVVNRDAQARLTISSPLEAHRPHALTLALVGVDVGYENPVFAALEVDTEEVRNDAETGELLYEKQLVYYELALGLNHVVRKWADAVDPSANLLVAVPGADDGPGGVLVCSENFVVYRAPGHDERRCALPRRRDAPAEHGLLIVASAVHRQRQLFFVLLQSEAGDLYKVSFEHAKGAVSEMRVSYLDTVPTCAALAILRTGFLFCASEAAAHGFYQFQSLGDDESAPHTTSRAYEANSLAVVNLVPRPLANLLLVDELDSMAPLVDSKLLQLGARGAPPSLVALCGRSSRSSLRIVSHGLAVTELAISELPGSPSAVWTVRRRAADETDAFIVVSFANATLVLAIGETVEEVTDSGLKADAPTLAVALMGDDSLVQVHPNGIHYLRADGRVSEWRPPRGRTVTQAAASARQLVVALGGGEIIYFELDATGMLAEVDKKDFGHEIACLDVPAPPAGRARARFLAVGGWDNTMRIVSLDPDDCMAELAVLALPAQAASAAIVSAALGRAGAPPALLLCVGLHSGVLLRARVDGTSGELSDSRSRLVGAKPVRVSRAPLGGAEGVLALSSRPWALCCRQGLLQTTPLAYQELDGGCSFASEHCREGLVAIAGNTLRILSLERLDSPFSSESLPLRHTPRHLAHHTPSGRVVVIEADHNALTALEKAAAYEACAIPPPLPADAVLPEEEEGAGPLLTEASVGVPRGGAGKWASCIRVVDPAARQTLSVLDLADNEAAVSVAAVPMRERGGETCIVVGVVQNMTLHPRTVGAAALHVYAFADGNTTLQLVHKTPVEDAPAAVAHLGGRVLVGVGRTLRLYEMGQKRLLRKAELRGFPTMIQQLHVLSSSRIVVGDLAESFHYVSYKRAEARLAVFADTTVPRHLTAGCALDYSTLVGADKFGNLFVTRLPAETSDDADDAGLLAVGARRDDVGGTLNGAPSKADEIANFHLGEVATSLQKATLGPGCAEVVLYTTLLGGIGALAPISHRDDVDFCVALEMHLRQEAPPLCGRDQLFFRSAYFPVKGVVDGDFLETYHALPAEQQKAVAAELDRSPAQVAKKLEDLFSKML